MSSFRTDHPILQTQRRVLEEFRVPVLSGTTVVVYQPGGLSLLTRADSYLWALATTQDNLEGGRHRVRIRSSPRFRYRRDARTSPSRICTARRAPARSAWSGWATSTRPTSRTRPRFRPTSPDSCLRRSRKGDYLNARLGIFELASLVLILIVVALAFRSLLAPLVVVGIAAVGYLVYLPVLTLVASAAGFEVPGQLEPVLLALLLGVVTDYCVLFFHTFRDELDTGRDNLAAARSAVDRNASIIAVAGLTVAGGTIALLAAPFGLFRALGPALALTVLIGLALSLTLTPAAMTILGWRLFTVVPVRGSHRARPVDAETPYPPSLSVGRAGW